MKIVNLFTSVAGLIFISGCQDSGQSNIPVTEDQPEEELIVFGIYTADRASAVVDQFAPVVEWLESDLSSRLGRPVKVQMKVANDYLRGISDLTLGKAHLSRLGPASFIHAIEENPELDLLAMESKDGQRSFKGVIAIHKDSSFETLADLKSTSFAFGDALSTIGRYLSQNELLNAGIDGSALSRYEFLGRHDKVGMAVAAGDFEAGALKDSNFKKLVEAGQPIKKLVDFDNVTKPWVAHPDLRPELREAIRASMLEISPENAEKIGIDGFLPAEISHYASVKSAMAKADLLIPKPIEINSLKKFLENARQNIVNAA